MWHMRYRLRTAIRAAEALDVDADLRASAQRLDHAAGDDGGPPLVLTGLAKVCYEVNPPELSIGRPYRPQSDQVTSRPLPELGWYFGQYPMGTMEHLRNGDFQVERDLPEFRRMIEAWRRPNGIVWRHGDRQLRPRRGVDRIAKRGRSLAGDAVAELGWRLADLSRLV